MSRALSLVLFSTVLSAALVAADSRPVSATPHHKSKKAVVKAKPQSAVPQDGAAATQVVKARPAGSQAPRAANPDTIINSSWNGGGNAYDVTIGTGSDNVSLDTNVTISSLTLGNGSGSSILQNLSGSAESLADLGALTINGGGQLKFNNGSTLTVRGGMTSAGLFSLSNGSTATITGNVTNNGGSIYVDALNIGGNGGSGGSVLNVNGTLANSGGGTIWVGYGASAPSTLNVSGTLSNATGSHIYVASGDSAATAGLLNVSRAAPSTLSYHHARADQQRRSVRIWRPIWPRHLFNHRRRLDQYRVPFGERWHWDIGDAQRRRHVHQHQLHALGDGRHGR